MTKKNKENLKMVIRICHWKYIARDKNGNLFLFEKHPTKYDNEWISNYDKVEITDLFEKHLFADVKWTDLSPKKIEKYLN